MPLPAGATFDRYQIEKLLGVGGMGEVYLAHDPRLQRAVAIKLLTGEAARDDATSGVARLLREARAAAALSHPNIVSVHDVGEQDGVPYLVMEFVPGHSLRALTGRADISMAQRLAWLLDVASALAAAHRSGLVHRDVKPDNVVIRDDGVVKVLDFGIARRLSASAPEFATLTAQGAIVGTPAYMAPEQLRSEDLDGRADQFSFGVLAYELLTGVLPWSNPQALPAILIAVLTEKPPAPSTRGERALEPIDPIIARAMEKKRDDRYPTMDALIEALRRATQSVASEPPPGSFAATVAISAAQIPTSVSPVTPQASPDDGGKPLPILSVPLPASPSSEAVEAYRAGLEAMRDADWHGAHPHFERAIELDHRLAAARLRWVLTASFGAHLTSSGTNAGFRRAVAARKDLSTRDRALLHGIEPLFLSDPPDVEETWRRMNALADARPGDAEIQQVAGFLAAGNDPKLQERYARRAIAVDPEYADACQTLATALASQERTAEALEALDRCVALSPSGADGLYERVVVLAEAGQLDQLLPETKRALAVAPQPGAVLQIRAGALLASGRPADSAREVLRRWWAASPLGEKVEEALGEARLAILCGDFPSARARLDALIRDAREDWSFDVLGRAFELSVVVAREEGRDSDAADLAEEYLARREGWTTGYYVQRDVLPLCVAVCRDAGRMTPEQASKRRIDWLSQRGHGSPAMLWGIAFSPAISHPDVVEEARARLPPKEKFWFHRFGMYRYDAGRVLHALGDRTRALSLLTAAARHCLDPREPFRHVHAHYWLGRVLEEHGDREGARRAHQIVLARWGASKSRSVTAESARECLTRLAGDPTRPAD